MTSVHKVYEYMCGRTGKAAARGTLFLFFFKQNLIACRPQLVDAMKGKRKEEKKKKASRS